jgi:hypothetical protein
LDQLGVSSILKILGDFGTVGLVIFLWWTDNKRIWAVLDQYKQDMAEHREMYKSNKFFQIAGRIFQSGNDQTSEGLEGVSRSLRHHMGTIL